MFCGQLRLWRPINLNFFAIETMKKLLAIVAAVGLPLLAFGQGQGFDMFGQARTLVLTAPTNNQYVVSTHGITNSWVDMRLFTGIIKVDFSCTTNTPSACTAAIQTSDDTTNIVQTNITYAVANPTSINYTNNRFFSNTPIATNLWNLAGTNTTPTAGTAGWATVYQIPAPFTNTGALTLTPNAITTIGVKVDDYPRYWRTTFSFDGGTGTNVAVSATITGRIVQPAP